MLGAGETQHTVVDEDVLLVVPDTAEIRVRAGTGSQSLSTQRRHAHQEFRRLCEAAGVADQSEARQAAQERKDAARRRQDALDTIARDLRDLTVDVLQGKIEGLTKRVSAYAAERPEGRPLPPDFETAKQVASAKARTVEEKRAELDNCNQAANSASSALQQERINESNLAGMIKMARNAKTQAAERFGVGTIPAIRQRDRVRTSPSRRGRPARLLSHSKTPRQSLQRLIRNHSM